MEEISLKKARGSRATAVRGKQVFVGVASLCLGYKGFVSRVVVIFDIFLLEFV
jgi:hypothetical protein